MTVCATRCDGCGGNSAVIDSRENKRTVRRRRKCPDCGARWTTHEVREEAIAQLRAPGLATETIDRAMRQLRSALDIINEMHEEGTP